ncbi:MAG: 3-deoxy-8-phosphooctulonate synthase [Pirellulaceae bacterium]|nr:3-deoxy-8-phosphooctulonate synthase [Planctomycetaceae bacterium]HIM30183.1 3-deoxy-8-phosphooctulonate synthase [Planctomycetota bacterium]
MVPPDASTKTSPTNHTPKAVRIGNYTCGPGHDLVLIAGPCVLESEELTRNIAEQLYEMTSERPVQWVFKASFDKANRTSLQSYRGPGLDRGLKMLQRIAEDFGVPVTTDIHEAAQAAAAAEVCGLLQIPAFLARQTDLLIAAAETGRAVNVKKGQFLAPGDMRHVVEKLRSAGCENVLVCERGTFFGYGRLVNDMRALVQLRELAPVVFDATHSVQEPGGLGGTTGGHREMVDPLARAAMAIGIDALFVETHIDPDTSPSDGPNMIALKDLPRMLDRWLAIRATVESIQ